jgi:hypothetical protein
MAEPKTGVTVSYKALGIVLGALWGGALATSICLTAIYPNSPWRVGAVICGLVAFLAVLGGVLDG